MQYRAKMPDSSNRVERQRSIQSRVQWCREKYGPESLFSNYGRWHRYKGYIYFSDDKDLTMFLLKWS